jgi:hypothetical protein
VANIQGGHRETHRWTLVNILISSVHLKAGNVTGPESNCQLLRHILAHDVVISN